MIAKIKINVIFLVIEFIDRIMLIVKAHKLFIYDKECNKQLMILKEILWER